MTKLVGGGSCVTSPRHPQCRAIACCRLTTAANSPPTRCGHLYWEDVLEPRGCLLVHSRWRSGRTVGDCSCDSLHCRLFSHAVKLLSRHRMLHLSDSCCR